jgi:hypothetical protein
MFRPLFRCLLGSVVAVVATGCSGGGGSTLSALPTTRAAVSHAAAVRVAASVPGGFSDDFSADAVGGPASGWTVVSGKWSVCQVGSAHAYCQPTTGRAVSLVGPTTWTDYTVDALVTDPNTSLGSVAIAGRATTQTSYYQFALGPQPGGSTPYWFIGKIVGSRYTILASGPLSAPDANPNYALRLNFAGKNITASVAFDGTTTYTVLGTVADTDLPSGQAGVSTSGTAGGQFANFVVTPAGPALTSESAVSTASFLNSIGMNADLEAPGYSQKNVRSLIANLGVRHYRVAGGEIVAGSSYLSTLTDLHNSYGITFNVLANLYMPAAQVIQAIQLLPAGSVISVEGPNEADCPGNGIYYDPNFATDVPPYMQSLYNAIKSTPATAQVTVIGPSFCLPSSYAAMGGISSYVDAGNVHDYFSAFNPGTPGWGGTGYSFAPSLRAGAVDWDIAMAAQATGTKPVIATETGYCTAIMHGCVPLDIQAKYLPRLFLEQYRHNIPFTYNFKLVSSDVTSGLGTLGIVNYSGAPNPAYTALAGMISTLSDGTTSGSPLSYNWALTGQTLGVDHLLMHKADGTLILPLWIEAQSLDPNANGGLGSETPAPVQTVMVNFAQSAGTGTLWTCNTATGVWSSNPITMTNGAFTLNLADSVSILVFKPS